MGGGDMKKAVFLGDRGNIDRVYAVTKDKLAEKLEFIEPVYDRECLERCADVNYIFTTWGMWRFTKEQIAECFPSLEAVFYAAGSVQSFAREFIESEVKVFSAWGANAIPVAQFTVAEILLALKGWYASVHRSGEIWHTHGGAREFPGIMDEKVGIVGAGTIGKLVIGALRAYPVEVLVYDKFMSEEKIAALGGKKADLEEIFSECLVISNHLANLPATVGMLDYSLFSRMRSRATFINTGRGAQVVADDMIRALREDETRTALLDVTDPDEPPHEGSELYTMANVYLTPHIAGSMGNEIHRMAEFMYEEYMSLSEGGPTRFEVTAEMLATMA